MCLPRRVGHPLACRVPWALGYGGVLGCRGSRISRRRDSSPRIHILKDVIRPVALRLRLPEASYGEIYSENRFNSLGRLFAIFCNFGFRPSSLLIFSRFVSGIFLVPFLTTLAPMCELNDASAAARFRVVLVF